DSPESPASNAVVVLDRFQPQLSWPAAAPIVYGTALSNTQLNASATYNGNPVAGNYTYTPALGAVLAAGNDQVLTINFVPVDCNTFNNASTVITITVSPGSLSITAVDQSRVYGAGNPIFLWTVSGLVNGYTMYSLTTPPIVWTTATLASAVGTYPINISCAT